MNTMTLDDEQIEFLSKHNISLTETFNATGLNRSEYQKKMQQENKIVAFGVTPCSQGHTLRTRAGHCIQCDSARLAFMKRHVSTGEVYIAGSINGQLIKIGFTKGKAIRAESLNRTKYGGFADWIILCTGECLDAGKIESEVNSLLSKYGVSMNYKHDNSMQKTYELFSCSYETAVSVLKKIQAESNGEIFRSLKEDKLRSSKYSFQNLIRQNPRR